jgi:hypothetical protein
MRVARLFALLVLLPLSVSAATEDAEDWKLIGGVLALVQEMVHLAAHSPDAQAAQKGVDAMLGGGNARANRIASGVMEEVMQEIPPEHRGAFLSIGRDLLTLARREQARAAVQAPAHASIQIALQARRDLHAMGLRYWDEQQFAAARKRGDRIAVDLFVAAQGLRADAAAGIGPAPSNPLPAR